MSDEQYGARGPVPVENHISDKPVGAAGHADPRAMALQREREIATTLDSAVADPTGSILLTELQEIRTKLDILGLVSITGIWLVGMCIGYAGFVYYKNYSATVAVESETENDGE